MDLRTSRSGKHNYLASSQTRTRTTPRPGLKIPLANGDAAAVKKLSNNNAEENLGMKVQPDGCNKRHLAALKDKLEALDVKVEEVHGHTLFDPDRMLKLNGGSAPLNMTGFQKLASKAGPPPKPQEPHSFRKRPFSLCQM